MTTTASSSKFARWLHTAACVLILLIAAAHTMGHLQGPPTPKDDDEATLLRLFSQKQMDIAGRSLTLERINSGFSWYFGGTCALIGVAGLSLTRKGPAALRTFGVWGGAFAVLATVIGALFWPWPPVAMTGVAGVLFIAGATMKPAV